MIEFTLVGTAVRYTGRTPSRRPSLTNLSGQDFWKLVQAGYLPLGLVVASTMYFVVANAGTQNARSWWRGRGNQELEDFTQGLNAARHIAMKSLRHQGARLGGTGIVGTEIEREIEAHYEEEYFMLVTFHALATAIAGPARERAELSISPVVNLSR
jgi:uncharacterized protein YbjQ (UPF0145 family)